MPRTHVKKLQVNRVLKTGYPTGGQGTLTVLYRQTSFGTFGGGDANTCDALANISLDIACRC